MFDPAIKLFGKTIPLPDATPMLLTDHQVASSKTSKSEAGEYFKEEPCKPDKSSTLDNPKKNAGQTPNQEKKAITNGKPEKDESKTDCDGQEKALKKPDKIIRCPRCNSLETKFCYYNNYNVNQPRHFCRKCQRYWTAGGTMRNVPVGAGRRKNKHIVSHYCHTMSSDALPTTLVDTPDSDNHQANSYDGLSTPLGTCNGNGSVLKFGSDGPLCESMSTILTLRDQNEKTDMDVSVSGGNREEVSFRGSSTPASTCNEIELRESVSKMDHPGMPGCFEGSALPPNPMQYSSSSPWVYPWNSGWNSLAAMAAGHWSSEFFYGMNTGNLKQVQLASTPMVATPAFCSPSTPFPVAPTSYWSCVSGGWASGAWNMAWNGSIGTQSLSTPSSQNGCSDSGSPTLGKHSRDANTPAEGGDEIEKCLWVPKSLRIDDPGEAAKSSIWATLGIKPGQNAPILKGGIFRAFQPKKELNDNASDATQILQVNPAAFSRSQTFQEST